MRLKVNIWPWLGGSVGWSIIPSTKRLWVQFQSGHIPRLRVQSLVGAHMGSNQQMFLYHINVLFFPFSFFEINKKHILGEASRKKVNICLERKKK